MTSFGDGQGLRRSSSFGLRSPRFNLRYGTGSGSDRSLAENGARSLPLPVPYRLPILYATTETIRQEHTSIMKRYSSFTLAFALALSVLSVWAVFAPTIRRAAAFDGDAYAIKGGTVVTVTGATIQKGTVIIRNGLIEAVGADIPVPGDARVIDATGMTVYPGLIDSYSNVGLGAATPNPGPGGRGG